MQSKKPQKTPKIPHNREWRETAFSYLLNYFFTLKLSVFAGPVKSYGISSKKTSLKLYKSYFAGNADTDP